MICEQLVKAKGSPPPVLVTDVADEVGVAKGTMKFEPCSEVKGVKQLRREEPPTGTPQDADLDGALRVMVPFTGKGALVPAPACGAP